MKLAVGFITYNQASSKYLADFLPSLNRALQFLSPEEVKVYAFDNSDGQDVSNREAIESWNKDGEGAGEFSGYFHTPIYYMSKGENVGFSRAYNIILEKAFQDGTRYFFMINPDTVLADTAISLLLKFLEEHGEFASAAPKILRWDFPRRLPTDDIDSLGLKFNGALEFLDWGQGKKDNARLYKQSIIGPSGAAGIFRMSALAKLKGSNHGTVGPYFDERFFMYKEDCDLAYRLFLKGLPSILVPESVIYHDRTAFSSGRGLFNKLRDRSRKDKLVRAWSFYGQELIFKKYFKMQTLTDRFLISFKSLLMFIFSLFFEPYNLKLYFKGQKLPRK